MKTSLINFVLFQLGWLACVISAANQQPLIGAVIASLIIVLHVWRAKVPGSEVKLIGLAVLIGLAWDSVLVWQGVLVYSTGMWLPFLAPYWIIMMWALFATTLNVSLRWLKGKFLYAVTFGAIGGPLAYYAGQRLGAVEFSETYLALGALFVGWAVFTPLLMVLSERFDGYIEARA
jgi:hypothetical protein